jgi:GT2 family glycosyltransferase
VTGATPDLPAYGCVVLSQGRRPDELRAALVSLLAQTGVRLDVLVVGNGWQPVALPPGVRGLGLPHDLGIPGGRAAGVPHVRGPLLLFMDDDAELPDDGLLAEVGRRFADDPTLGLLQPRVVDPEGRAAPRRWVPRLRVGDPARSSDVAAVWEGAVVARRDTYERAGGWPVEFRYGHEGIDLAWGVWDAGARVRYAGDLVVHHPAVPPARHPGAHRLWARNRVWLARRRLPVPLGVAYVLVWLGSALLRARRAVDLRDALLGTWDGLVQRPDRRRPISWRAAWRMTRAGRPPVV